MMFWLIISIAFVWLGHETRWLTVRLPSGSLQSPAVGIEASNAIKLLAPVKQPLLLCAPVKKIDTSTPYWWQSSEAKQAHLILCQNCDRHSRLTTWRLCKRDTERWTAWKLPAKTIKAWGTTMNLAEGCNIKRALFLKSMAREVKRESTPRYRTHLQDLPTRTDDIAGYDFKATKQWLCGKAWFKKHYKDVIPEPTMEVIVNGKTLSVNGNYKKGVIQDFMGKYTERKRVGKKVQNVVKGSTIVDYGGGLKIAELPEDWKVI